MKQIVDENIVSIIGKQHEYYQEYLKTMSGEGIQNSNTNEQNINKNTNKGKLKVFVDGSGNGGWGAVLIENEELIDKKYGYKETDVTNNIMEMTACINGIKSGIELGYTDIEIYTDSGYVSDGINNKWYKTWQNNGWRTSNRKPVKNKELWKELVKLVLENNIKIIKVKGHSGNKYNELSDELATKGSEKREVNLDL